MLLKEDQIDKVDAVVQPTQLIAFALISGVLIFALISLVVNGTDSLTSKVDIISLVGIVIGAAAIGKSVFLPEMMATSGVDVAKEKFNEDPVKLAENLARVYQTKKIFQMALLEGAAFANLIFFFSIPQHRTPDRCCDRRGRIDTRVSTSPGSLRLDRQPAREIECLTSEKRVGQTPVDLSTGRPGE